MMGQIGLNFYLVGVSFLKKNIFSPQFDKCPTLLKKEIFLLISSDKNMILSLPYALVKSKFFT